MTTLYKLTEQFAELNRLAESEDIPPEVIRDTVEGLSAEWEDKAINVAKFILNAEALAESIKQREQEMNARRKRLAARAESLRQYMLFNFQATGRTKLTNELFDLAVRNNPQSVVVDDIKLVPDQFLKDADAPPTADESHTIEISTAQLSVVSESLPSSWRILDADGNIIRRGTIQYLEAEADKKAIGAEFKAGRDVPGCHPEQGQRLDIVV